MSALQEARRKLSRTELLDSLNDSRRRDILRILSDEAEPIAEEELVERLLVGDGDRSIEDLADATVDGVHVRLRHVHLPRLADAELVDWDDDEGTVAPTDSPVYDDPEFQRLLDVEDDDWNAAATPADGRRQEILSVLESRDDDVARNVLVHELAARQADGESWADAVEDVRTQLHHVHLPKLDRAGVIDYDADTGTVMYRGHPSDDRW